MNRVVADESRMSYTDEALRVSPAESEGLPNFVQVFAEQIPATHGAPQRRAVAAQ